MTSCSRRRKTKHPFCKDDPNCYWDKNCRTKNHRERSANNSVRLTKLDTIMNKLSSIENKLIVIEKNTLKSSRRRTGKRKKGKIHRTRFSTNNKPTSVSNENTEHKIKKDKTASLRKVDLLMKDIHNSGNNNPSVKADTISPEARQKIRDL